MPRRLRCAQAGFVYHVLNRAAGRATLFRKDGDYAAFLDVLRQARHRKPIRLLAYCLMPTHWHLVLWPYHDDDLSSFMHWLTLTHSMRWHTHYHTAGTGPLYQGRFRSFPVQEDDHLLTVLRYVERNPLRANLVKRAQDWPWSSLHLRGTAGRDLLDEGPVPLPANWKRHVNMPLTEVELEALRRSVSRGNPFGEADWQRQAAEQLGLQTSLRPRGRPRKH
jgi:putative transposase